MGQGALAENEGACRWPGRAVAWLVAVALVWALAGCARVPMRPWRVHAERIVVAPDCGLGLLDRETAMAKLRALRAGADAFAG